MSTRTNLHPRRQATCQAEGIMDAFGSLISRQGDGRIFRFLADESGQATLAALLSATVMLTVLALALVTIYRRHTKKQLPISANSLSAVGARVRELCGRREDGSNLVETALILPILILLLVGCVDYGRGFYSAMEVSSAAESGALYGTLNSTDTTGMVAMAKLDAAEVTNFSATASFGCQCADGTGVSVSCTTTPVCSANVVQYVEVITTGVYNPVLPYPGIPSSINLQSKVHLRTYN